MSARRILYPVGAALALWLAFTVGRTTASPRDAVLIAPDGQGCFIVDVYDRNGELLTTARLPEETSLAGAWPYIAEDGSLSPINY